MSGIHKANQQGIGIVEVMVSLALLAIGVLGFSAMHTMANKATDESMMRTRALSIIRGGAEMMRANPLGIEAFKTAINATAIDEVASVDGIEVTSCIGVNAHCNFEQLATRDAIAITTHAKQDNLHIAMLTCPTNAMVSETDVNVTSEQDHQCFIVSWGRTTAKLDDSDNTACANANGIYKSGSQCFIIEAY